MKQALNSSLDQRRHCRPGLPSFVPAILFLAGLLLLLPAGCRSPQVLQAGPGGSDTTPAPSTEPPPVPDLDDEAYREMELLTRTMMLIRRDYVDEDKTRYHDLIYGALTGMLQSLDPHSQFLEPDLYEDMRDDTAGEYGGLGIYVGTRDGLLTVISPIEDTPAFRAGILSGDRIIEIDGQKTDDYTVKDAVQHLRGEQGSKVRIRVLRGASEIKEFELVRDLIKVPSVKGTRLLTDRIGYVRITQFSEPTADALRQALESLTGQGMRALILDLRNNPGGLLTSAIAVSEQFLDEGDLIVFTKGRGPAQSQPPVRAGKGRHYTGFPMAILVNGGSASASEIVAGALQDHGRAILIGELTFGKASVQTLFELEDGSAVRLTTAHYYTPSERPIHDCGIEPDIVVPMSSEEFLKVQNQRAREESPDAATPPAGDSQPVTDPQLERAADLLKGILIFTSPRPS